MNFEREKQEKERQIQQYTKELADMKGAIRQEKRVLEDIEEYEDKLDADKVKLMRQLEQLDEEMDRMNDDEDDDLLIQKLEEEAAYLDRLLRTADEENSGMSRDIAKNKEANHGMEIENLGLEQKAKSCRDLEPEIKQTQNTLTECLDLEKELFEENLRLLNELKNLELQEQEASKNKQAKEI